MLNAFASKPTTDGVRVNIVGSPSGDILDHYSVRGATAMPISWASPELGTIAVGDSAVDLFGLGLHTVWYFKAFAVNAIGDYFDITNTCRGITLDTAVPDTWPVGPPSQWDSSDGYFTFELQSDMPEAGQEFELEVAKDRAFNNVVYQGVIGPQPGPGRYNHTNTQPLRAGQYYWRCRRTAPSVTDWSDPWVVISYLPASTIQTKVAIMDPVISPANPRGGLLLQTALSICRSGDRQVRLPFFLQLYDMGEVGGVSTDDLAMWIIPAMASLGPWDEAIINAYLDVPEIIVDMNMWDPWTGETGAIPVEVSWFAGMVRFLTHNHRYKVRVFGCTYSQYVEILSSQRYAEDYMQIPNAVVESDDTVFTIYDTDDILEVGAYQA